MSGPRVLLVDFGASRVKAAVLDTDDNSIIAQAETSSPVPLPRERGIVELDPQDYIAAFLSVVSNLEQSMLESLSFVWICAEMHGALLDDGAGRCLTPYLSWRDARSAHGRNGKASILEQFIRDHGDYFHQTTGMRAKPGLPILTLLDLAQDGSLPTQARLLTIPEWIAVQCGEFHNVMHESLAAGTGLYSLDAQDWSSELLELLAPCHLALPTVATNTSSQLGVVDIFGKKIPLMGGFGDLQTAVFGAGVRDQPSKRCAVNIGTGSQVVRAVTRGTELPDLAVERRPFFDDSELQAITHIASGRALSVFALAFDEIAALGGGKPGGFWSEFAGLRAEDIVSAPLQVDPRVFDAAWGSTDGGAIRGIWEQGFTAGGLVASIAKGWLGQYVDALDTVDRERDEFEVVLAGGLVRRCPAADSALTQLSGRRVSAHHTAVDETITGLQALSQTRPA